MTINDFINELELLGIKPTEEQLNKLDAYATMLIEYNKKFNLTAITKKEDIYLKHFYDSLTITKAIDLSGYLKILDIGTGAGFPGLVLKIFFPNIELTLLDSNNKKILFLNEVIKELDLKNVNCIHSRAEELPNNYKEYFDLVTSRAVAHLRILTELAIPYLKVNGLFIPLKGNIEEELQESTNTITKLKSEVINIINFNLPIENSTRNIVTIKKCSSTPTIYPRAYDKIKKKAL